MPAGSGPSIAVATAVAVGTAETAIVSCPVSNWQDNLGNLVTFSGYFTAPAAAGTLVLRIRQGNGVAGAIVGPAGGFQQSFAISGVAMVSAEAFDNSAFGLAQAAGQYTITAQYAAAAGGSMVYALAELETVSTVT